LAFGLIVISHTACAEVVTVRDRGPVDLRRFVCEYLPHSTIRRVCVDKENQYMIVQLGGFFLHYCGVDTHQAYALVHAERPSKFFASEIKGRFSCGKGGWPPYN
jgi:hypothetical protein